MFGSHQAPLPSRARRIFRESDHNTEPWRLHRTRKVRAGPGSGRAASDTAVQLGGLPLHNDATFIGLDQWYFIMPDQCYFTAVSDSQFTDRRTCIQIRIADNSVM